MSRVLEITAADGHRFALTLQTAEDPQAPVLLIGPAMGTPARVYAPLSDAFVRRGLHAAVLELRGVGSSSLRAARTVDFGYRTLIEQDWAAARQALRAALPQAPLVLFGHSLGGQIALLSAAARPDVVAGVVIVAAGSVHWRGWRGARAAGILAFTQFAGALAAAVGYFPGPRVGFGGNEARTLMRDWARLGRSGDFRFDGGPDYEALLARCAVPALGISFEHDQFAPHRAQQNLLAKLPAARVTQLPLSAADSGAPLDHYSWIKQPAAVVDRVVPWILDSGAAP